MGRRPRHWEKEGIYHISNRCAGARHLLVPTEEANRIILGALARFAHIHDIELFGWVFMSNHFHLLARARRLTMSAFMRDLQKYISQELRSLSDRSGWDLSMFPVRFKHERILDDEALLEKIMYLAMNPVEADLVAKPGDWPGVSSFEARMSGEKVTGTFLKRSERTALEAREASDEEWEQARADHTYELQLTNPPSMEDKSVEEAGASIFDDIEERCEQQAEWRRIGGESVLGADRVRETSPYSSPDDPADSPHPICHTTDPELREDYRQKQRRIESLYKEASERWRNGETPVTFPKGTFPPGHSHVSDGRPIPNPQPEEPSVQGDAFSPP